MCPCVRRWCSDSADKAVNWAQAVQNWTTENHFGYKNFMCRRSPDFNFPNILHHGMLLKWIYWLIDVYWHNEQNLLQFQFRFGNHNAGITIQMTVILSQSEEGSVAWISSQSESDGYKYTHANEWQSNRVVMLCVKMFLVRQMPAPMCHLWFEDTCINVKEIAQSRMKLHFDLF